MEGPSLVILREELNAYKGKRIEIASGSSKIDFSKISGKKIKAFRSWGKHFLIELRDVSIRIHFLMFGSYRVNERKNATPRLCLQLENGDELNFYSTAVRLIEDDLDQVYDWSADVMNDEWSERKARKKLKNNPELNVCDALLDQNIFSGVGNIIKNEVLYRIGFTLRTQYKIYHQEN
ncbi:DNA-formamidopyrimidine glycosylase family protein [Chryseosolibacter indicus]|uniref:DNA-formamidopyrimidine glycosylase family protein n=1 Tax=Chryseosolibacter indicus TaxID=2782351 RepID=UPI0020B1B6C6|nr:DNA-formamidopyrimidine glycosylase family protein [Chryseosolibacter indicus]